jgi:parvulin-like peptidyl-prolyl isomerase
MRLAVLCCAAWLGLGPSFVSAEKMDTIVAIVNGDIITEADLAVFTRMTAAEAGEAPSASDIEKTRQFYLQRLIDDKLILQEAKRLKYNVNERTVEERIKQLKVRAGSPETFELALRDQGITLNELRDKLRQQLLIYAAIQAQIRPRVIVSPMEVTEYYNSHLDEFAVSEAVVVDSLFVEDPETLAKVQQELQSGADFLVVAEKYSKKSSLGPVRRGQLKKELEDYIFGLALKTPSAPYEVDGGYYIFLPQEHVASTSLSLDEVKDKIKSRLEREKSERLLKEWIVSLKDKAYISIRESS